MSTNVFLSRIIKISISKIKYDKTICFVADLHERFKTIFTPAFVNGFFHHRSKDRNTKWITDIANDGDKDNIN